MPPRSLQTFLMVLGLLSPALLAQRYTSLGSASDLEALAERDARLSFTVAAADRARAVLDEAPLGETDRAVAAMVLGASRSSGDLARIESLVADGKETERAVAVRALGELGSHGVYALERALERDTSGIEEELVVAFVHALGRGTDAAFERVESLARREDELGRRARLYVDYARGGRAREPAAALELYYRTRWSAALAHGFIDGKRWQRCLLEDLFLDPEFLDRVILAAAADLDTTAVRDHLFEILRTEDRPGVLRTAAVLMPGSLAELVRHGAWQPATTDDWRVMLEEIDRSRSERAAEELLELAFTEVPELQPLIGLLLLRAGADLSWHWIGQQLVNGPPELRSKLIEACGDRADPERVGDLVDLLGKRLELPIFGEGLVALARLGHEPAGDEILELVKGPASERRDQVVSALARVLHDRRMVPFAEHALRLEDLSSEQRFELQLGFAVNGKMRERELLRMVLPAAPDHPRRIDVVRALATGAELADLASLRELFPVEDDLDLNVELAVTLVRSRDRAVLALLRAALWSDSWNRSVLAGGLIVRTNGIEGLIGELETPAPQASERDFRRVGFAIGEWGGLQAVEALSRTRKEGDAALQGALLGALSRRGSWPY